MGKQSYTPFVPLRWRGSLFLYAADVLTDFLLLFSPLALCAHFRHKPAPMWFVDLGVGALLGLSLFVLVRFNYMSAWGQFASPWFAAYLLVESLAVLLRDVAGSPSSLASESPKFLTWPSPRSWNTLLLKGTRFLTSKAPTSACTPSPLTATPGATKSCR